MFEGYGVGLTVAPRGLDAGAPPARLTEVLPVAAWTDAELAGELGRVQQLRAALAAYEAALVVALAGHRPDMQDPVTDGPGMGTGGSSPIPGVSEFFVHELAAVTDTSARAAGKLAGQSWLLMERLPCVWAALADGALDWSRAWVFLDVLGPTAEGVAEQVAPRVLPEANRLSLGRLRARLHRQVLTIDAAAADRRRAEAERAADVRIYPTGDGMAELAVELPAPLAAACWTTVDELARMAKADGDSRPIGQLRAGVFADLMLRPWDAGRPPITAALTVLAPLPGLAARGLAPDRGAPADPDAAAAGGVAEVNGLPITVAHVRALLEQLDAVCPGGLQAPTGGSLQVAIVDADGALRATAGRAELERLARRGCPRHPRGVHCGCAVLDRPPSVDRYAPSPLQRRFVQRRDRTCRHPNCGQPVGRTDLDHVMAHAAGGPTACENLCCLCRTHHRLKTHARGWRFELRPDGVLVVTTPSGVTRTTRPPGLRDLTCQPALPAPPPDLPDTLTMRLTDEPPPF